MDDGEDFQYLSRMEGLFFFPSLFSGEVGFLPLFREGKEVVTEITFAVFPLSPQIYILILSPFLSVVSDRLSGTTLIDRRILTVFLPPLPEKNGLFPSSVP